MTFRNMLFRNGDYNVSYLISYVVMMIPFYLIYKKAYQKNAWLAFIPILNFIPLLDIIDKRPIQLLWLLVPIVDVIVIFYWYSLLLKKFGFSAIYVILLIVPLANLIFLFYIALSEKVQYRDYINRY